VKSRILTTALLAVTAIGAFVLSASAGSSNPKAPIQSGNAQCGANLTTRPTIGFTNYHRQGNMVSFQYHLKGAIPNAAYRVDLWGNACSRFGILATIHTNGNGVANGGGSVAVPAASTRFFATAFGPNGYNDTPAVTLMP
jgi:hypothetical protein